MWKEFPDSCEESLLPRGRLPNVIPPRSPDGAGSLEGADSLSVGLSSSPDDHDLVLRQLDTPFKEKFPTGLTKDVSESELLMLLQERAFFLTGRAAPPGAKLPEAYSLIKLHKPDENSEHIKSRFISACLASPCLADIDMVLFASSALSVWRSLTRNFYPPFS